MIDAALATDGLADAMTLVRMSQLHAFAESPDIWVMSGEVGGQLRGRIGRRESEEALAGHDRREPGKERGQSFDTRQY